jgi:hypothetical protein
MEASKVFPFKNDIIVDAFVGKAYKPCNRKLATPASSTTSG